MRAALETRAARALRLAYRARVALMAAFTAAGAAAMGVYWQSSLVSKGIEDAYFRSMIAAHEGDYLAALRDSHLGCKTIAFRSPDVAIVGDSHSYAGWDYPELQRALPGRRVGACVLAGMFPENLADFLRSLRSAEWAPRYVVFGIQPRMFWDVDERKDRVGRARRQIRDIPQPKESLPTLATGHWRDIEHFKGAGTSFAARLRALEAGLATVDPNDVEQVLHARTADFYALTFWLKYVEDGKPYAAMPAVVRDICAAVRQSGVRLGVAYIPESRWLNERYSPAQRTQFLEVASLFRACADWVDVSPFESAGWDNRDFINRYLLDDYPYAGWRQPDIALAWIAERPNERRWHFFDPDHMNASGARMYSHLMGPKIAAWSR